MTTVANTIETLLTRRMEQARVQPAHSDRLLRRLLTQRAQLLIQLDEEGLLGAWKEGQR